MGVYLLGWCLSAESVWKGFLASVQAAYGGSGKGSRAALPLKYP